MHNLPRRKFLVGGLAAGLALIPHLQRSSAIPTNRVVHTHSDKATSWNYSTGWYGDYVSQSIVDQMTDRGMMDLTGADTRSDAWRAIIPGYTSGQVVAIKINLNNAGCGDDDNIIDALPQPINSVILGLKSIGVPENKIWVYDVTRGWHTGEMPARLVAKVTALYPGVQFHSSNGGCSTNLGYSTTQKVHFTVPANRSISDRPICNALVNAQYLINIPIMKKHGMAGVTLSFKNHFGSLDGCDLVHWSVDLGDSKYLPAYSGLVDIYKNTHFKDKTVLTIGDGLYGARYNNYDEVPNKWPTFGNHSPNSLFFSKDPVAIDCVMYDFLALEGDIEIPAGSDNYLKLANSAALGTFEHWDTQHLYHSIDYRRIEVGIDQNNKLYLPVAKQSA
jgi:hypothetical protein